MVVWCHAFQQSFNSGELYRKERKLLFCGQSVYGVWVFTVRKRDKRNSATFSFKSQKEMEFGREIETDI